MMDTPEQSHNDNLLSPPLQATQQNINKPKDSSVEHVKNLKYYIENNYVDELNKLLEDEHIQKKSLNTGLCIALQNCRANCQMLEIIEILLNHDAEPDCHFRYFNKASNPNPKIDDKDNVTILMYSCLQCNIQLIDLILKYNPDINLKDKNGKNALFYAILSNKGDNVDVIDLLCRNGIEINCSGKVEIGKNDHITHSPLSLAAIYNMPKTFEYLVKHGGDINFKTLPDEDSLLHIAVRNGNMDIIGIILETSEAFLEEKNKEGKKSQDLALMHPQTDLYDMIGKKINEKKKIETENATQLLDEERKQIKKKKIAEQKLSEARQLQQQQQATQQAQLQQQQYQLQSMKLTNNNTNNYPQTQQQQQNIMQYNQGNISQVHTYNNISSYDNYYTIKENEDEANEHHHNNSTHTNNYYNNNHNQNENENLYKAMNNNNNNTNNNSTINNNMIMMKCNYTDSVISNPSEISNNYLKQNSSEDPSFIQIPHTSQSTISKSKFSLTKFKREQFHKTKSQKYKKSTNILEIPFNFCKTIHPISKLNSYISNIHFLMYLS